MTRQIGHTPQAAKDARRDALIGLMQNCYEEIRAIESQYQLLVEAGDLRPRIEYFHDAVRALTAHPEAIYQLRTRLSVEWLAWDLSFLRYIQDKPLAKLNRNPVMGSGHAVTKRGAAYDSVPAPVRGNLAGHYRNYTVFFAALFADPVDRNFQARVESMNHDVEDIAQVEQMLQMLEQGSAQVKEEQVEQMIQMLDNEEVKQKLMVVLHQRAMKRREKLAAARALLKEAMKEIDGQISALDKAHMSYLSGQLVLFQDAKDIIKRLSGQGLNLAGQFLDAAMQQAGKGQGRGY